MIDATEKPPLIKTRRLNAASPSDLSSAAAMLAGGKLVAIPTETVYGLAASAMDEEAIAGIFAAKGRPGWDPLIVHISDMAMLARVVREVPAPALQLMARFWPGPLTLLLPRHPGLPDSITAGRPLVAVRMPAHPAALEIIRQAGVPVAAPSANLFGHISPTTVEHVLADLDGRIDAVVDGGAATIGVESTVLDVTAAPMILYRQGGVSAAEIQAVTGQQVTVYSRREDVMSPVAAPSSLPSPGIDMRHYAPRARVLLVHSEDDLQDLMNYIEPATVGVLLPEDWAAPAGVAQVVAWPRLNDTAALARTLYSSMRALDSTGVPLIVCPLPPASARPLTEALRDRLMKAARDA